MFYPGKISQINPLFRRFSPIPHFYHITFLKPIFHLFSHFPQFPIFQEFLKITKNHIFTKITLFTHDSDFAQNRHFPKNPLFDLFPQNGQNGRSAQNHQNHQNAKNAHFPKIPKIGQKPQNPKNTQNWPFLGIGSKLRFRGDRGEHTPYAPHRTDN